MDSTLPVDAMPAPAAEPSMSPFARAVAIFTRPGDAWGGLREHAQWWFPLLIVLVLGSLTAGILHNRAIVPMVEDQWQEAVNNGQMPAEEEAKMEAFFESPAGLAVSIVQAAIFTILIPFVIATVVWFGVSFVLGRKLGYRLALEVAAWAGLVTIPAQALTTVIAWSKETMRGVHAGFGLLLPDTDTPNKLHIFFGFVLDAFGPLSIWYVAILIIGAATLSGAPKRSTAWVIGGLYLALSIFLAAVGALVTPTS
jgi:Yip1 domain